MLRADVLDDLRAELGADRAMLDRAWTVVEEMHASAPPVLRLEERLTWLGLRDRDTGDEVDALLRQAVISMVDQEPRRHRPLERARLRAAAGDGEVS